MEPIESGLDPNIIGRIYKGTTEIVDPEKTMAYAKATNETNPRYYELDENKLSIPVLFPVTMAVVPLKEMVTDSTLNLDISRMVHGEQEIRYFRPLRPWDKIKSKLELESIDFKESGDILWAKFSGSAEDGLVFEMRAGMFFRKQRNGSKPIKPRVKEETIEKEIIITKQMKVTSDQSVRYATASGDDNPIHLDKDIALAVGLPDIILHGLCTLAFAIQAIVDGLAGGDPTKVKSVKTRFSKPVFMNNTLTTEGWLLEEKETSKIIDFETKNESGETVLEFGSIELLK
ncbi:MAG: MaoC/PaaZ C-terminal domain-containing protein [Candidatus Hodarchaeota archaeon]